MNQVPKDVEEDPALLSEAEEQAAKGVSGPSKSSDALGEGLKGLQNSDWWHTETEVFRQNKNKAQIRKQDGWEGALIAYHVQLPMHNAKPPPWHVMRARGDLMEAISDVLRDIDVESRDMYSVISKTIRIISDQVARTPRDAKFPDAHGLRLEDLVCRFAVQLIKIKFDKDPGDPVNNPYAEEQHPAANPELDNRQDQAILEIFKVAADKKKLGLLLRRFRKQAGMTQQDVASATGQSRPNIAKIEAGKVEPRWETLVAYVSALSTAPP
ncbi:MAG: helix-turn-helix transcriptional regulator [Pseudomonadota bacterium]